MLVRRLVFLVFGRCGGRATISISTRRFVIVPFVRGAIAPFIVVVPIGILFPVLFSTEFVLALAFVALAFVAFVLSFPFVPRFPFHVRIARCEGCGGTALAEDFAFYASALLFQEVGDFLFTGTEFGQFICACANFLVVSHGDGCIFRNRQVEHRSQMRKLHGNAAESFPGRG